MKCSLVILGASAVHGWSTYQPSRQISLRRPFSSLSMSTNVEFAKYEGLGNDFILIDDRDKEEPSLTSDQSAKLCDRNFGIGGDGVIFALKAPSDDYSFKFRIYNSDGSEPEMCGNGIRCYAQFLKDLLSSFTQFITFRVTGCLNCQILLFPVDVNPIYSQTKLILFTIF